MSKLILTILDADNAGMSVTEHDTLTEALNEFAGWGTQGATDYIVQGSMDLDCACKRVMESRNRTISLAVHVAVQPYETCSNTELSGARVELKAPQVCKFLQALSFPANSIPRIAVQITSTEFRLG